jgi:hypothetical protein
MIRPVGLITRWNLTVLEIVHDIIPIVAEHPRCRLIQAKRV